MKSIKNLFIGLVVGLLVGLWFGVNVGKGRPIYSNPFTEVSVQQRLKRTGESIMEKSGQALEKGGKALQDSIKQH